MKKLMVTTALIAALGSPLGAADGHRMLANKKSWSVLEQGGVGGACPNGCNGVRPAKGIPSKYEQNRRGWLNSGDANVIESKLFSPEHGLSVVKGRVMDGQDEGTTRVQVFDFGGNEILNRLYNYKGPKADGDVTGWKLKAKNFGKTGWRGVTIRYTMTDQHGPEENRNKNGISFVHNYRADPTCQQTENATRGRAPEAKAPSRTPHTIDTHRDEWSRSQRAQRDERKENARQNRENN